MIAIIPLLVCVAGLIIYFAAQPPNTKLTEVGRALFWCGLLVTLFVVASKTVKLF